MGLSQPRHDTLGQYSMWTLRFGWYVHIVHHRGALSPHVSFNLNPSFNRSDSFDHTEYSTEDTTGSWGHVYVSSHQEDLIKGLLSNTANGDFIYLDFQRRDKTVFVLVSLKGIIFFMSCNVVRRTTYGRKLRMGRLRVTDSSTFRFTIP